MDSSSHTGTGEGGGVTTVEGDEQDDPSSSSIALKTFREEWKKELDLSPQHVVKIPDVKKDDQEIPLNVEDKAKLFFQLGVENEEKGKLYEAIQFYRRAFQLVPDIEFRISQQIHNRSDSKKKDETEHLDNEEEESEAEIDEEEEIPYDPKSMDLLTHLHYIMQKKSTRAICSPHHPTSTTHISCLPMEIFLYILRWVVSTDLDFRSLEMCSQVSRGFYICCRDPEIWRAACSRVWGLKCGSLNPGIFKTWRDMFIFRPKPQYTGCYISKTSYMRPGENSFQDSFYRPWHLVQYYRYLRFFADGRVLMLTTVEEPGTSVGLLKGPSPTLRSPPICIGYYRLHDNVVSIVLNSVPENKRPTRPNANSTQNHSFHLELEIVSHRHKLHGKLVWRCYSVFSRRNGVETNTTFDLDSTRYPPFWFSRVKSYTAEASLPLL